MVVVIAYEFNVLYRYNTLESMWVYHSFFIIVNLETFEFHIEMTQIRDWRLRLSAMKSLFKKHYPVPVPLRINFWNKKVPENVIRDDEPAYFKIFKTNHCVYLLEKGMFDTEEEALERLSELQKIYKKKLIYQEICLAQQHLMSGVSFF